MFTVRDYCGINMAEKFLKNMPQIFNHTKPVGELTPTERATMFGLLSLEFLGARIEDFNKDLAEKECVVLLRKDNVEGEIVGFSTLMLLSLNIDDVQVKVVFSGDTTVLPEFRMSGGIGIGIGQYFLKTLDQFPRSEIYYVLISKGWRTYSVMPFFFKDFAPKHDASTSDKLWQVMNAFGKYKYPNEYVPELGTVMFARETQRLIPGSMDAVPPQNPDKHTQHFLKLNPTYLSGTELVCVAKVNMDNLARPLQRLLRIKAEPESRAAQDSKNDS